jgi:hypothetical protein
MSERSAVRTDLLPALLLPYAAASLIHHVHNAEFLSDYPNMPAWLSAALVYGAWLAVTAVGAIGYLLIRYGHQASGLAALTIYGMLGFYGLAHYTLAPASTHTMVMNATIWLEAATALLLLTGVVGIMLTRQQAVSVGKPR